jgi:serpin B
MLDCHFRGALALLLAAAATLGAQRPDSTASLAVHVTGSGKNLQGAVISVGSRSAGSDSAGTTRLDHLSTGPVHALVRAIGFRRVDTTIVLQAGKTVTWNVTLKPGPNLFGSSAQERHEADSINATTGAVDSAAGGLLPKRAAGEPPYAAFGARLLALMAGTRGPDSNTVVSPLSAGIALALVAGGARNSTYRALAGALGDSMLAAASLARRDSVLLAALSQRSDVTLDIANALWLSPRFQTQSAYVDMAARSYGSSVRTLALSTQAGVDTVNAWANEKTHGKINAILGGPLNDGMAVVVTNAVYFRGLWLTPFDSARARPMAFHSRPGITDTVPTMERTAYLSWLRAPGMQAVRLPYRFGRTALYVFLPDSGVRVDDLEARLARDGWPAALSVFQTREVHLRLPRIHAEMTLDLASPLQALGAGIAFDCRHADFRAMLAVSAPDGACIQKAAQKTFLDVDEKGTVAVAVTSYEIGVSSAPPPPLEFIVDRPFLFALRDEVTGLPLFLGRIVSPARRAAP